MNNLKECRCFRNWCRHYLFNTPSPFLLIKKKAAGIGEKECKVRKRKERKGRGQGADCEHSSSQLRRTSSTAAFLICLLLTATIYYLLASTSAVPRRQPTSDGASRLMERRASERTAILSIFSLHFSPSLDSFLILPISFPSDAFKHLHSL